MRIVKRIALICLTFTIMFACTGCMSKKNKSRVAFYTIGYSMTLEEQHNSVYNEIMELTTLTDANEVHDKIHSTIIPKLDELIDNSKEITGTIRTARLLFIHMLYTGAIKEMKELIDVDIDGVSDIIGNDKILKKSKVMSDAYYVLLGGLVIMYNISAYDIDYEAIAKDLQKDALKGIAKDIFNQVVEDIEEKVNTENAEPAL